MERYPGSQEPRNTRSHYTTTSTHHHTRNLLGKMHGHCLCSGEKKQQGTEQEEVLFWGSGEGEAFQDDLRLKGFSDPIWGFFKNSVGQGLATIPPQKSGEGRLYPISSEELTEPSTSSLFCPINPDLFCPINQLSPLHLAPSLLSQRGHYPSLF